jgi:predicted alpha/beta-hydrolase family hydrolase
MAQGTASLRTVTDRVPVPGSGAVPAVTVVAEHPADFRAGVTPALVLAPGAGSRLEHPFLANLSAALAPELLVLRFNFPYQEAGRSSPDPTPRLEATYRAVLAWLRAHPTLAPGPLFAGGKSMGGRMGSHLAAAGESLQGLVLLGYPLHPPGKPEQRRDAHLPAIRCPMLFVQGTRDPLCDLRLLEPVLARLTAPHRLVIIPEGDHSFKAPKRAGRSAEEIFALIRDELRGFIRAVIAGQLL